MDKTPASEAGIVALNPVGGEYLILNLHIYVMMVDVVSYASSFIATEECSASFTNAPDS